MFPGSKLLVKLFSIRVSAESHVNSFDLYESSNVFPNTILPLITLSPKGYFPPAPLVWKEPSPFTTKEGPPPVHIATSASAFSNKFFTIRSFPVPS